MKYHFTIGDAVEPKEWIIVEFRDKSDTCLFTIIDTEHSSSIIANMTEIKKLREILNLVL